jgi:hypothetical protein
LLTAANTEVPGEDALDDLVRRVLLSMLEQRRLGKPAQAQWPPLTYRDTNWSRRDIITSLGTRLLPQRSGHITAATEAELEPTSPKFPAVRT